MGKGKQAKEMAKKFNRNVEISAPILDPEIIKAIHTPPKGQKLDLKNGGFKALLADMNSQDSTDELSPLDDNHVPTYIGISCAVSGYSNYSSYIKRPLSTSRSDDNDNKQNDSSNHRTNNSNHKEYDSRNYLQSFRSNSPYRQKLVPQVNHIKIDKSSVNSVDEERRELTEKLTASAHERRRSPSPCIPPTEDDRHHGAYVRARYCPVPPPSKLVNKHIPLLGIDDDQDPDEVKVEERKVEDRIASLYGDNFVEDWRQSNAHKVRREQEQDTESQQQQAPKAPRDLVTLKPTPPPAEPHLTEEPTVPLPATKVLAGVDRQFLNKLLTDENPPVPSQQRVQSPVLQQTLTKTEAVTTETKIIENVRPSEALTADLKPEKSSDSTTILKEEEKFIPEHKSPSPVKDLASEVEPEPIVMDKAPKPVEHQSQTTELLQGVDEVMSCPKVKAEEPKKPLLLDPVEKQSQQPEQQDLLLDLGNTPSPKQMSSPEPQFVETSPELEVVETTPELEVVETSPELEVVKTIPELSAETNAEEDLVGTQEHVEAGVDHIEYQIRAQSPVDNESSPVHMIASRHEQPDTNNLVDDQLINLEDELRVEMKQEATKVNELITIEEEDDASSLPTIETADEHASTVDTKLELASEVQVPVESDRHDGHYFLGLMNKEIEFISRQVAKAEEIIGREHVEDESRNLDEETIGKLRSAVGMANLLINKKFKQFGELCQANINKGADEQYATLDDDLAGFWDMIDIQISDVRRSFSNLWTNMKLDADKDDNEQ